MVESESHDSCGNANENDIESPADPPTNLDVSSSNNDLSAEPCLGTSSIATIAMADSHVDGKADENDIESPAAELPTPSTADYAPSSSNKQISAEPPRWRFVADAKRSSGYSSLAAGQHIQGKTSDELGAKYVAPDVSLYKAKGEKLEVGKLQRKLPAISNNDDDVDLEVGKLKPSSPPTDETSSDHNIEVGQLETTPIKEEESSELQTNVSTNKLEEGGDNNNELDGESSNCIEANEEASLGATSMPVQNEGGQSDDKLDSQLDEEDMKEDGNEKNLDGGCQNSIESKKIGTSLAVEVATRPDQKKGDESVNRKDDDETTKETSNIANPIAPKNKDADDSTKEINPRRIHRRLYLEVFVLLTLVIVLAVSLGRKTSAGEASTTTSFNSATKTPDVPDPFLPLNSTSRPSSYPIDISTYDPSTMPSASPSKNPSTTPSEKPSDNPSIAPTDEPTHEPSRKPSSWPTLPPTHIPTSKPMCAAEPKSFSLCLAINMSGSICNGRTGALCTGCPQIILSSDIQESFCRDVGVNWNSCCSNFANVKELATSIVRLLGNLPVDKYFSVVQFASDARLVSGLSSTGQTLSTISQLSYTGGLDNHASGIQKCQQTLSPSTSEKRIIMLVTDGETGTPDYVPAGAIESAATSAKNEGTFIFTVLVPPDAPDTNEGAIPIFSRISSNGEVFDFTDRDMSSVLQVQEGLLNHVSCPQ